MPRKAKGLTAAKVRTAKPGRYGDGAGLYLLVRGPKARFWLFRYEQHAPVVAAQTDMATVFSERRSDVIRYHQTLDQLDAIALSETESTTLILSLTNARSALTRV